MRPAFLGMESPGYRSKPFLTIRSIYLDVLDAGHHPRMIHGLIEEDVTDAKAVLRRGG